MRDLTYRCNVYSLSLDHNPEISIQVHPKMAVIYHAIYLYLYIY